MFGNICARKYNNDINKSDIYIYPDYCKHVIYIIYRSYTLSRRNIDTFQGDINDKGQVSWKVIFSAIRVLI